jgi:hypothetical protein
MELPKEAGFPEEDGVTHWALEVHYSNPGGDIVEDETGYDFCATDELRKYDADVMRAGSERFSIGPRQDKTIACKYSMPKFDVPSELDGLHVISATPHMHDCGRELFSLTSSTTILAEPNFDLRNQVATSTNAVVKPEDDLWTMCRWQNDDDRTVTFGERTGIDEMCYVYLTYYPKITAPDWNWNSPAADGECTVTKPPLR